MGKDSPVIDNQLLEDKGFLTSVLESVQDSICVLNPDLTIRYSNKLQQKLCKENTSLARKKCFEVFQNRTDPCDNCPALKCIKSGKIEKDILPGPPCSPFEFVDVTAHPIKDSDTGEITGVVEIMHDIIEQKKAEEALRESEHKYRGLIEGLDDTIYRMTLPEGRYEYFSPSVEEVFGYTSEEFINNPLLIQSIIHPDSAEYFKEKWKELLEEKIPETYEYKIIDSEGNERWIVQSNKAIYDDSGRINAIEGLCRNITEKKKAEEVLRQSEQKFSSILNSIHEVVWSLSLKDGELLYMSPSVEQMFGRKPEEFKQNRNLWIECAHPDDISMIAEKRYTELGKKGLFEGEHRIIRKDGNVGWVRNRIKVIYDEKGEPDRLDGLFTDITKQKQKEDALKESEEKLSSILNSIEDVVWSISLIDGSLIYVSPSIEKVMGRTVQEFNENRQLWMECVHPDYRERIEANLGSQAFLKKNIDIEFMIIKPDKSIRWVRSRAQTNYNEAGKAVRVDGIITDITDRKEAEEALRESEQKLSSILNAIEDVVMSISLPDAKLIYLSPSAEKLFGRKMKEFYQKGNVWLEHVHPDDLRIIETSYKQFEESGFSNTQFRIIKTDGSIRPKSSED